MNCELLNYNNNVICLLIRSVVVVFVCCLVLTKKKKKKKKKNTLFLFSCQLFADTTQVIVVFFHFILGFTVRENIVRCLGHRMRYFSLSVSMFVSFKIEA